MATDPPPADNAPEPSDDAAIASVPEEETITPPTARRPGLIRWKGVIILLALIGLALGSLALWGDRWLIGALRGSLGALSLRFGPDTQLEADLWSGALTIDDLALERYRSNGRTVRRFLVADSAELDSDVLASLTGGGVILDRLVLDRARLVSEDVPLPEDEQRPPDEDADDEEADELPTVDDLRGWWEESKVWRERWQRWFGGDEEDDATQPQPSYDWQDDRVVQYHPPPSQGGHRFLIRELRIDQLAIPHPVRGAESNPFNINDASLTGSQVSRRPLAGETMALQLDGSTEAAGPLMASLKKSSEQSELTIKLPTMPMPTLAHPSVGGNALAPYGLHGTADATLSCTFQGGLLDGRISMLITDFDLQPTAAADSGVKEAARIWQQVQEAHATLKLDTPLVLGWQIGISGSLGQPRFTGGGSDGLRAALVALKDELIAAGKARLKETGEEAKKQVVDEATKQGKGMLDDVMSGKDPKDSGEERSKDAGKKVEDGLKNLFGR